MNKSLYCVLSLLFIPHHSHAESEQLGIIGASATYGNDVFNTETKPQLGVTPNLFYFGEYGFIDGNLINFNPIPYLGLSASWRFATVSNDVTTLPDGIEDRDGNPELGITLGSPGARITYLADIGGVHKGQEIQLHLGRTFDTPIDRLSITPFIEVDWRDKKLAQHLYGITAQESQNSNLLEYQADSTFVYQAGLINLFKLSPNWLLINQINIEHHDSDSQLIQRDIGWSFEIGLTYQFAGK